VRFGKRHSLSRLGTGSIGDRRRVRGRAVGGVAEVSVGRRPGRDLPGGCGCGGGRCDRLEAAQDDEGDDGREQEGRQDEAGLDGDLTEKRDQLNDVGDELGQRAGYRRRQTYCEYNKKLSYRRGTARCAVSVEILPIATQQCRNYLYDKS